MINQTIGKAAVGFGLAKRLLPRLPATEGRTLRWVSRFCNQRRTDRPPSGGDWPTAIPDAPIQTFFDGVHPRDPANYGRLQAGLAADKMFGPEQGGYR